MANDQENVLAARASMQFVEDGQVVGLGSGSTAAYAVQLLGERVRGGLKIRGIPTSVQTQQLADELRMPLLALNDVDEVDPALRLIKGGGGALLREKVVASASRKMVVIADSSKQVSRLGRFPLPVEVIAFAETVIRKKIAALGASVKLRQYAYGNPFTTDEGHHVLDCSFGEISDPPALARELKTMP